MIGNRSDNRRHGTGFKPTFRRRISRIKSLDTWWYVAGCVYMVGVTRTRPIFDLDRIGALIKILVANDDREDD